MLLCSVLYSAQFAEAQIAPTSSATIAGTVSDVAGRPVAHATILLKGPKNASTTTDVQGQFVFVGVPFGTYSVVASAAGLGTAMRSNVLVEGDVNIAIQYEPESANGLKVIANVSSAANARFNVTPASITQVNPIANAFEGKTSWRTILEQIPGVAQAGLGNGQFFTAAFADGPFVPIQVSINGTLPYETATLLDDMPLIGGSCTSKAGSGTDLSLYPLNGFGSADVIRGPGANAPSIVDSIGGSFVLHAPTAVQHDQYSFSLSTDPYGGIVANSLAEVHWKKLSVLVTYGLNDSPGPLNSNGIPASPPSYPYIVNGHPFSAYTPVCSPPGCQFNSLVNPNYASASFPFYGAQTGLLMCCVNQSSAWVEHSGSVALIYNPSATTSVEIFYVGEIAHMPTPESDQTVNFLPPAGYAGSVSAGEYAFSGDNDTFGPFTVQNSSSLLEEKVAAQIGRGVFHLAALQNRTFATSSLVYGTSATVQLFGGGTLNGSSIVFNGGTTYNVTFPESLNDISSSDSNNRDFLASYSTPLGENFHVGASFVKSYYNAPCFLNEQYVYYGTPGTYNAAIPSADSQTTNEARIVVGGNLSEKTSLDLSMYATTANYHVQDPNNLATYTDKNYSYAAPRLGFVWRPTASVAIRAAAGGGFAEAPLGNLVGSNGIPFNTGLGYYTVTLTNLNLQPEKSFGFDLGTDIRLHRNTTVSFDVYHSDLYGQFYRSTSTGGSCSICGGLPLYTLQYGNLGVSRYEGVLIDVHHDVPHGIYWSFSGGLTRGYLVSVPSGFYNTAGGTCNRMTGANCANLAVVPNVNFNGTFANSIPYAQSLGILGYRWNANKYIDLIGTYYGNNNTYFRPAFVEFDGHVSYPVSKNVSFLVTFRNITGVYDNPIQVWSLANMSGAPTISGLPYPLYGEEYATRTVLFTLNLR